MENAIESKLICYFAEILCKENISFEPGSLEHPEISEEPYLSVHNDLKSVAEQVIDACENEELNPNLISNFKNMMKQKFEINDTLIDSFIERFKFGYAHDLKYNFNDYNEYISSVISLTEELLPEIYARKFKEKLIQ